MMNVHIAEKRYPNASVPIIKDLRFALNSGEFVAIVGPSGAGKSSLLNLIAGIDCKFEGSIRDQRTGLTPLNVGMMFQEARLMPWLTLLENVCLVSESQKSTLTIQRAHTLLNDVGLAGLADQYPNQLSGGMQRRVALARALMAEPDIMLLDEPLVSLDQPAAAELRELLLSVWQARQFTVVYVTHQLDEAVALADRILFLSTSPSRVIREEIIELPRPRRRQDIDALTIDLADRVDLLNGRMA
jgi:NitT/TauT family transport system ATP-binding protein